MPLRGKKRFQTFLDLVPFKPGDDLGLRPERVSFARPPSATLWNEPRDASFHHCIQPLSSLNSIDFVKRVVWKGGDVETFSRASHISGCGEQRRAALNCPRQEDLGGVFPTPAAIAEMTESSGIRVPNPSPGICPAPRSSGIFKVRKSLDSLMANN
jgi:hypothetical protein